MEMMAQFCNGECGKSSWQKRLIRMSFIAKLLQSEHPDTPPSGWLMLKLHPRLSPCALVYHQHCKYCAESFGWGPIVSAVTPSLLYHETSQRPSPSLSSALHVKSGQMRSTYRETHDERPGHNSYTSLLAKCYPAP